MFSDAFLQQIELEYGNRGIKGLEIVNERRVKQYKDYFVVVGERDEYVVEDEFCTCRDFLFNSAKTGVKCSHMIAVEIAKQKGIIDAVDAWYQDVRPLP
ncbi:MAG: SWIM zinc finger family protein [Halobacteriota archaeon]